MLLKILIQERDDIIKRFEKYDFELAAELRVLLRMLSKHSQTPNHPITQEQIEDEFPFSDGNIQLTNKMIKPVAALRRVFSQFPDREFIPAELNRVLEDYHSRKELVFRSNNIPRTTHTSLRVMLKSGFIVKIEKPNGIPAYKKA